MPITKDLSVSPYFQENNGNYYQVLFKPSVAVQVRELNELQAILQKQIEKFGNNIYKRGTIIDGCNFIYYPNYAYIKINDSQLDGTPAVPSNYVGAFIIDESSNLTAHIVNSSDGFESTDPDLKTLYVRYINSGNNGVTTAFTAGTTLTIYDYLDSVNEVLINNGSSGWSNTDTVVFCSALQVNVNSSNNFTVGETITQTGNTHSAVISAITTYKGATVLQIKPRQSDLSNTAIASTTWQFDNSAVIIGSTSGATATINTVIGSGAAASLVTSADVGKITSIAITNNGSGYYVAPYVSIKSSGINSTIGARNYTDLNLTAHNYVAQVTVANKANSVGYGYAFGVTEGVVYQKGFFLGVDPQTIIISKYNPSPNNVSVGFSTDEETVDSNIDQTLLDNSTGQPNEFAPGADRLKLTPIIVVANTDTITANEEFLSLVDFSEGRPFRQNQQTEFNTIMDEMALRTKESSGNFVLDQFLVTTRSPANSAFEGNTFTVAVDPGRGYIDGYRVETTANYFIDDMKGIDVRTAANLTATIDYGNFVLITEVAGVWDCNIGATVNLKDATSTGVSNTASVNAGTLTSSGNTIGTAQVRNIVFDSGEPGTNSAKYRLYLFNIQMNAGQKFSSVRGVQIGSTSGIADIVLSFDATSNSNICQLSDVSKGSSLLVSTGSDSTANIRNLNYVYRQTNETLSLANNGSTSLLLTDSTETFDYGSTTLTDTERKTLILVPSSGDIVFTPNTTADGTASVTSSSNTITINSATVNKYSTGDFVSLYSGASTYVLRRVTNKTATTLQLDSNVGFTNTAASFSHAYPKNIPVNLHRIATASVTTSGGGKTININLGSNVNSASAITCSLTYDVKVTGATPKSKTASRDNYVKLQLNSSNLNGPWCLGIPDIFRLKGVYLGSNSSVNTTSTAVTEQFYIDHNQTPDYYGLGYLYKKSDANINLANTSWLLVQFDAFTTSGGVFTLNSYVSSNTAQRFSDDSLDLASLGTKTNSFEVPEMYTPSGDYYDLLNYIDFRPIATPTASYANTPATANTNPASALSFSGTTKKFPLPESGVQYDRDSFLGRRDLVVVNKDTDIQIVRGAPSENPASPPTPKGVLLLNKINIPPYPDIPARFSSTMKTILDRKMASERLLLKRVQDHTINISIDASLRRFQQPRGYSMSDIGALERRISDLENTVALSLVEADLKDKVIPSIASPGLDRFKFGFFADDYSTTAYSDINHVEYRCQVVDSKVVPLSQSTGTPHGPDNPSTGNCVGDVVLIAQNLASVPTTNSVSNTSSNGTVIATFVTLYQSSVTTHKAVIAKTGWIQFSSVPSTFKLDYNIPRVPDTILIQKQSSTGSITTVYSNTISGVGTLNFNHDPTTGRNYKITLTRAGSVWDYTLTYPIDSTTYVGPKPPSPLLASLYYEGSLLSISPSTFVPQKMEQNFGQTKYVTRGLSQTVSVAGLKPSTSHTITIGNTSAGITAKPILTAGDGSGAYTSTVVTDESGTATFKIVVDNSTTDSVTSLTSPTVQTESPSSLNVTLSSGDNTSVHTFITKTESGNSNTIPTPAANVAASSDGNDNGSPGDSGGNFGARVTVLNRPYSQLSK